MLCRTIAAVVALYTVSALTCQSCEHPEKDVVMTRNVQKRMQPEAINATVQPRGPLAYGQLNILHTTDTHGWYVGHGLLLSELSANTHRLEGHLKASRAKPAIDQALTICRKRTMGPIGAILSALAKT